MDFLVPFVSHLSMMALKTSSESLENYIYKHTDLIGDKSVLEGEPKRSRNITRNQVYLHLMKQAVLYYHIYILPFTLGVLCFKHGVYLSLSSLQPCKVG